MKKKETTAPESMPIDKGNGHTEPDWEVYDHPNGNFQVLKKFIGAFGILCEVEVFKYSAREECRKTAQSIADMSNNYPILKAENEKKDETIRELFGVVKMFIDYDFAKSQIAKHNQ